MNTEVQSMSIDSSISALKNKLGKDLVILAHHYQDDEIVKYADITGDSLELARKIPEITAKNIVFCGVYFMAESAALLARREQRVFIPDSNADCAMARMATASDVEKVIQRLEHAGKAVLPVAYVNSSLEVKAAAGRHGGTVCTSSNARKVLEWAFEQDKSILFLPDRNLGINTANAMNIAQTETYSMKSAEDDFAGINLETCKIIFWPGYCPIHENMTPAMIEEFRTRTKSGGIVYVHGECIPEAVRLSDGFGSTAFIIKQAEEMAHRSDKRPLAMGTEEHLVNRLRNKYKGVLDIVSLGQGFTCEDMEKITPEKLLNVLTNIDAGIKPVSIPEELRESAKASLVRMLDICK